MLIASIAMQVVLSAVCQPKAEALPQEYRSSQLGFSIRYPEGWVKGHIGVCGNTYMGLDEAGMRKAALYPVRLRTADVGDCLGMSVTVWREMSENGRLEAYPNGAPGRVAFATPGVPNATKWTRAEITPLMNGAHVPSWTAIYSIEKGARVVQLTGTCNAGERAKYEPMFDEMARTVALFEPTEDQRQEGGVKEFRRPRFTFEYPGEWIVTGIPHDDEEADKSDGGVLRGPQDPGPHAFVGMRAGQTLYFGRWMDREYKDGGLEKALESVAGTQGDRFAMGDTITTKTAFLTSSGVQGWRVVQRSPAATKKMKEQVRKSKAWAKEKGKPIPPISMGDCAVTYLIPLDGATTVCFTGRYVASTELDQTLATFDAIVRSFKIVRRPGDPELKTVVFH